MPLSLSISGTPPSAAAEGGGVGCVKQQRGREDQSHRRSDEDAQRVHSQKKQELLMQPWNDTGGIWDMKVGHAPARVQGQRRRSGMMGRFRRMPDVSLPSSSASGLFSPTAGVNPQIISSSKGKSTVGTSTTAHYEPEALNDDTAAKTKNSNKPPEAVFPAAGAMPCAEEPRDDEDDRAGHLAAAGPSESLFERLEWGPGGAPSGAHRRHRALDSSAVRCGVPSPWFLCPCRSLDSDSVRSFFPEKTSRRASISIGDDFKRPGSSATVYDWTRIRADDSAPTSPRNHDGVGQHGAGLIRREGDIDGRAFQPSEGTGAVSVVRAGSGESRLKGGGGTPEGHAGGHHAGAIQPCREEGGARNEEGVVFWLEGRGGQWLEMRTAKVDYPPCAACTSDVRMRFYWVHPCTSDLIFWRFGRVSCLS